MKFKHGTRRRALEYEKDWVQRWKADGTFEKSVENRPKDNTYVFYDGPPFISGVPHHGTLLSSIVKDAIPRYQTMKGKRVERVWGWDCHGLPAERYSEKKLGLKSRQDVLNYGLEKYIVATRDYMNQTAADWEQVIDRIGRWVDFQGAYKTMDKKYMESVWWAFKTLYEKGKIYEGEKVLMYCTLDGTPLSKAEVTMDAGAYQDVTDPSVFVKFKLSKIDRLKLALESIWAKDTSHTDSLQAWSESNKSAGQCAITAVLVNDIFGGKIAKIKVGDVGHFFNIIDGEVIDLAREQFGDTEVMYEDFEERSRDRILADSDTKKRYELLKSRLSDDWSEEISLLAWTTTPWTLPANTALAVNPKMTYVEVEVGGEKLIVAKSLVEKVFVDEKHQPLEYKILREIKGKDLVGLSYEPLLGVDRGENAHKVWAANYVSDEDGTGIVHLAPAYGEEDFALAQQNGIPVVHTIDQNGFFTEGDWQGANVWEINKQIAKDLKERGVVWKIDYTRHSYPHCHRCGTRLMYRALPSWFVDIADQRELMLEQNQKIDWFPEHVKNGRFAKNIEQAPDWNINRDRFWATAIPVWKSPSGKIKVVGSYAELKELSGVELEDYHRPWIDDVKFTIDGEEYTRIDKVMDSWFEAASMPFAQFHYPFENKEKFENNFPGDFIVEYIGQVRAWFYYMHAMSVALFGENSFKNVIVTGNVAGNDGRKMSKSYGNYTDPNELMNKFSADSLRFLLLSSPLLSGEDFALQDKEVGDVARKLSMIWNMYDFFTMYAEVDGWEYDGVLRDPLTSPSSPDEMASRPLSDSGAADVSSDEMDELRSGLTNPLDIWIVSRVHQLAAEVERHMDGYNLPDAMSPILPFLDDASNWYVRRSRRRFWRSSKMAAGAEDDGDKNDAYRTLHYVLVRLAYILAPFTPFLAEELYHNLTGDAESIHLKNWLPAGQVNQLVVDTMTRTRELINGGLSVRMKRDEHQESVKVRQPLQFASYAGEKLDDYYEQIIAEELNVKEVRHIDNLAEYLANYDAASGDIQEAAWVEVNKKITPELKREGLMREVIRHVQAARKNAGLNVDDRIILQLETTDEELAQAIAEHTETINSEALATSGANNENSSTVKIEGVELRISLEKNE